MDDKKLKEARQRAEKAVHDMADGALKVSAFEVILARLLAEEGGGVAPSKTARRGGRAGRDRVAGGEGPTTVSGRILGVKEDGFFGAQRTLPAVREELRSRGWHYPLTTLSGSMQRLVRDRALRRERVKSGNKRIWAYSNP
jgi:hypothetical protein